MTEQQIHFNDGAAYEQMMGKWSRITGNVFLDWLAPAAGLRWIDVGCGNGAFTELIVERCAPAAVTGIDPSEAQLTFARARHTAGIAQFRQGVATDLPFPTDNFDVATMALVLFFVPDPVKGVGEMVRVTAPGGLIAAYAWDMPGGGFPLDPIHAELRAVGAEPSMPPSADASRMEEMQRLWTDAGLKGVETRTITVQRTFSNFEEMWTVSQSSNSLRNVVTKMPAAEIEALKARVKVRLQTDGTGPITCSARANAVKGTVPLK